MRVSTRTKDIRVPIFRFFLITGTMLYGLLHYASTVLEPVPFNVTQKMGLPKRYHMLAAERDLLNTESADLTSTEFADLKSARPSQ